MENYILSCNRRILRFLAGVSLRERVSSKRVADRCGLLEVSDVARTRIFQWLGHVQRREEGEPLSVLRSCQIEEDRPKRRPKKSWVKMTEDDMRFPETDGTLANNRQSEREDVIRVTPQNGNQRR